MADLTTSSDVDAMLAAANNAAIRTAIGAGTGSGDVTLAGVQTLTNKRITPRVVAVAYAATVTPNADTTDVLNVGTLTGNITIAAPTGTPTDGQRITYRFTQDGTGGRTYTWNAAFAFGTDITAAMLPTTASAKCELLTEWNATDSKWRVVGLVRGF